MIIATILARAGSKGFANKNIRLLLGKPMIAHTILQAQKSKAFDHIAVSSDSDEILKIAKEYGVTHLIKRPEELASDSAAKIPAIRHCTLAVEENIKAKFDMVVDLDCSSPLRRVEDIHAAIESFKNGDGDIQLSASLAHKSPYFNIAEIREDGTPVLSKISERPYVRRQDAPRCYDLNGSIYIWSRQALFEKDQVFGNRTKLFIMEQEHSYDVDTALDFAFVEFLAERQAGIASQ